MKNNLIMIAILTVFTLTPATAIAHSGRTDSSGGHNCSASSQAKGLCSGYHYHNGGTSKPVSTPQPIVTSVVIPSVASTTKLTIKPSSTSTPTPSPTLKLTQSPSPNPTLSSTPSPSPEIRVTQTQVKKSGGFWSWLVSLFGR